MLTFAYFGADAFVTLAIVTVRHHSLAEASIAVTGSTLGWTAGAGSRPVSTSGGRGGLVRLGLSWSWLGGCGMLAVLRPGRAGGGGLCGLVDRRIGHGAGLRADQPDDAARGARRPGGMGVGVPQSLRCARFRPRRRPGRSGHRHGRRRGWALSTGVAVAFALPAAVAVAALAVSGRLPLRASAAPTRPVP